MQSTVSGSSALADDRGRWPGAAPPDRLNVVASFSILGDFVRNVGGDRVDVTTLVGPNSDAHVYVPTPADAKKVADAKLVFVNGLGFEGWMQRLVQVIRQQGNGRCGKHQHYAAQARLQYRSACLAVSHQCQNVCRTIFVMRSAPQLPQDAALFEANAEAYRVKLEALEGEMRPWVESIPPEHRKVISTHTAFGYFAKAYGIEFIAPRGVSTESEPSARDIAGIITQIKTKKIPAVFLENISDPRLIERIAAETGARVGGTLYSDSLTDEKGDAPTYIDMVRHNIRTLRNGIGYGPGPIR